MSGFDNKYYSKIKDLNIKHYAGEVPYYSKAELRPVEKSLLKQLKSKSSILDLGCGSGRFSIGAAQLGLNVTGVDITPEAVKAATKKTKSLRLKNVKFAVGDMTELDIKDSKFDYVICPRFSINAVATFSKRQSAIKEMLRVVKPGGKVFIESFNRFYLGMGLWVLLGDLATDFIKTVKFKWTTQVKKEEYKGLLPGDMVYPSNKVKGATEGYAHIPTVFELVKLVPRKYKYKIYSIPELMKKGKFDIFRLFRYSIWIEIHK